MLPPAGAKLPAPAGRQIPDPGGVGVAHDLLERGGPAARGHAGHVAPAPRGLRAGRGGVALDPAGPREDSLHSPIFSRVSDRLRFFLYPAQFFESLSSMSVLVDPMDETVSMF